MQVRDLRQVQQTQGILPAGNPAAPGVATAGPTAAHGRLCDIRTTRGVCWLLQPYCTYSQANTPVRRPLPTPTSPLPPLPTSGEHLAALLGPGIPASLESVYAAGGATHALARLESLVGLRVADLPPPGAGRPLGCHGSDYPGSAVAQGLPSAWLPMYGLIVCMGRCRACLSRLAAGTVVLPKVSINILC